MSCARILCSMYLHITHMSELQASYLLCWVLFSAVELLAEIEGLKQKTDAIHRELQEVGRAAEVAAKRSRRLAERSQELQV